ncbi:LuxR C-terminal-related transcriptional regulator [Sodalis sp. (in: enterobacteria)]|uniref:LuxR C-terminal-related transcriptional regulator n=1 Tax=Sodalis sp. (in: enterobacteria) TaxID=1898979 RepID=UPI003F39F5F6
MCKTRHEPIRKNIDILRPAVIAKGPAYIHALSAKEAARVLNISHRTVENRLRIIYQKVGINSSSQLAEFCRQTKLHCNIPPGLLKMGSYLHLQ